MAEEIRPPRRPAVRAQPRLSVEELAQGILAGDRTILARAITLVESSRDEDAARAQRLLTELWPHAGGARRVGISGAPGVGKSTFIEALGMHLVEQGLRVAVLAVDPSSTVSGGSILGDKSRMARLALHPRGYIRPSPSATTLGGVARRTRETMLLCEAAGFDVVLVETVGVGQSETLVAEIVDFFLVLMLPGAGDELQGIKKGILELADLIAVNKADGENQGPAGVACREYASALRYLPAKNASWQPRAMTVSALTGAGIREVWQLIEEHHRTLRASGELDQRRRQQRSAWMWIHLEAALMQAFHADQRVVARLAEVESAVSSGELSPAQGAAELLAAFGLPSAGRAAGEAVGDAVGAGETDPTPAA